MRTEQIGLNVNKQCAPTPTYAALVSFNSLNENQGCFRGYIRVCTPYAYLLVSWSRIYTTRHYPYKTHNAYMSARQIPAYTCVYPILCSAVYILHCEKCFRLKRENRVSVKFRPTKSICSLFENRLLYALSRLF